MTSFENSLPMILNRTQDAIMPRYRELFARYDLTEQQWRVLRVLWASTKVTSAELSARTLLPAPSLVGILDRLEKKELVVRLRSSTDRRVVHVTATPLGKSLEVEVRPFVSEIDTDIRSTVTEDEWNTMQNILEKIATQTAAQSTKKAASK